MRTIPSGNVIITCAVTGAIHTPTMSSALPVTPDEIANACIEASEAGAAVVHVHVRDPETGEPIDYREFSRQLEEKIRQQFEEQNPNILLFV